MAATQQPLQMQLSSEEDLVRRLATAGCKVLEVYSSYAGPCKSVIPTYKKMRFEGKDEEVLGFLLIEGEACQQLDLVREHSGKSEPLFLVYRNGTLKAKVNGVNLPQLVEAINDHTQGIPGLDDLEDNPFYFGDKGGVGAKDAKHKAAKKK